MVINKVKNYRTLRVLRRAEDACLFERRYVYPKMKNLISLIVVLVLVSGCSGNGSFEGLWQFPGKAVWIQINADGSVFQCRMPDDVKTSTSKGILKDDKIVWERIWKEDIVRKRFGTIYLNGPYGEYGYEKAKHPMNELCLIKNT